MKNKVTIYLVLLLSVITLTGCTNTSVTKLQTTMSFLSATSDQQDYIFYVTDTIDTLKIKSQITVDGEYGELSIIQKDTEKIILTKQWQGSVDEKLTLKVHDLAANQAYIIRFKGANIKKATVTLTIKHKSISNTSKTPTVTSKEKPVRKGNV